MKNLLTAIAACCIISLGMQAEAEEERGRREKTLSEELSEKGKQFRRVLRGVMHNYNDLIALSGSIKDAGVSYQKALTADNVNEDKYTQIHQQAIMSGVFMFDATYASIFLKKKDVVAFLEKSKRLSSRAGVNVPLTPKMKALLKHPESLKHYEQWSDALDESTKEILSKSLDSDKQLSLFVDRIYGASIEGLYVVTEQVVQSDYAPKMLAMMKQQKENLHFLIKLLDIFRDDEAFSQVLKINSRLGTVGSMHNILLLEEVSKREVDQMRTLVVPLRQVMLEGKFE